MERISVLLTVFLVSLQGSSAVTDVFVQKGNDFLLEVPKSFVPGENDIFLWRFNKKNNIIIFIHGLQPKTFDHYIGRVSVINYSVKLKNLTAADSGVYEARVTGNEERTVAEYNVTVQDPVSPVQLKVDSNISSSESCIINATCSTVDSDISSSFRCVHQTCDQDGREKSKLSNSGASLRIYLSNGSIICNHSNQVSWAKDMTEIQDFCKLEPAVFPQSTSNDIGAGIGIGIGVIAAVIILSGVIFKIDQRRKKRIYDTENIENTVYATPQGQTTQPRDESSPNDASCTSPESIYSLAGAHTGSTETRTKLQPESLYSVVQKPTKPCRNLQEL